MDRNEVLRQFAQHGRVDTSALGLGSQYDIVAPEGYAQASTMDRLRYATEVANQINSAAQNSGLGSALMGGGKSAVRGLNTNRATLAAMESGNKIDAAESANIYGQMQQNQALAQKEYTGDRSIADAWGRSDGALDTVARVGKLAAHTLGQSAVSMLAPMIPAMAAGAAIGSAVPIPGAGTVGGALVGMAGGIAERRTLGTAQAAEDVIAQMYQSPEAQTRQFDKARAQKIMSGSGVVQGIGSILMLHPALRKIGFLKQNGISPAEIKALDAIAKGEAAGITTAAGEQLLGKLSTLAQRAKATPVKATGGVALGTAGEGAAEYYDQFAQQMAAGHEGNFQEVYDDPELAAERREAAALGALLGGSISGVSTGAGAAGGVADRAMLHNAEQQVKDAQTAGNFTPDTVPDAPSETAPTTTPTPTPTGPLTAEQRRQQVVDRRQRQEEQEEQRGQQQVQAQEQATQVAQQEVDEIFNSGKLGMVDSAARAHFPAVVAEVRAKYGNPDRPMPLSEVVKIIKADEANMPRNIRKLANQISKSIPTPDARTPVSAGSTRADAVVARMRAEQAAAKVARDAEAARVAQEKAAAAAKKAADDAAAENQRRADAGLIYDENAQGDMYLEEKSTAPQTQQALPVEERAPESTRDPLNPNPATYTTRGGDVVSENDTTEMRVDRALSAVPNFRGTNPAVQYQLEQAIDALEQRLGKMPLEDAAKYIQTGALEQSDAVKKLAGVVRQGLQGTPKPLAPPTPTNTQQGAPIGPGGDVQPGRFEPAPDMRAQGDKDPASIQAEEAQQAQLEQSRQPRPEVDPQYDAANQGRLFGPDSSMDEQVDGFDKFTTRGGEEVTETGSFEEQVDNALAKVPRKPQLPANVYTSLYSAMKDRNLAHYRENGTSMPISDMMADIAGDTTITNQRVRHLAAAVHQGVNGLAKPTPLTTFERTQQQGEALGPRGGVAKGKFSEAGTTTKAPEGTVEPRRPLGFSSINEQAEGLAAAEEAARTPTQRAFRDTQTTNLLQEKADRAAAQKARQERVIAERAAKKAIAKAERETMIAEQKAEAARKKAEKEAALLEDTRPFNAQVLSQQEKRKKKEPTKRAKKSKATGQGITTELAAKTIGDTPFTTVFDSSIDEAGTYDPASDTVTLNPDKHSSPEELLQTLAHEVVHRGLVNGELAPMAAEAETAVRGLIKTDPEWKATAQQVTDEGYDPASDTFIEEVMVAMHEKARERAPQPAFKRLLTAIRAQLRKVPVLRRLVGQMSDGEVMALLRKAEDTGRNAAPQTAVGPVRASKSVRASMDAAVEKGLSRAIHDKAPSRTLDAKTITKKLPEWRKHYIDKFFNRYVNQFSSIESKMRKFSNHTLYVPINGINEIRADVIAADTLQATQLTYDALRAGGIVQDATGRWKARDGGVGMQEATKLLKQAADRLGMDVKAVNELFRQYVVAGRVQDVHNVKLPELQRVMDTLTQELIHDGEVKEALARAQAERDFRMSQLIDEGVGLHKRNKDVAAMDADIKALKKERLSKTEAKQKKAELEVVSKAHETLSNFVDTTATEFNTNGLVGYQQDQIDTTMTFAKEVPELEQARNIIRDITRDLSKMQLETGLIDQQTYEAYQSDWYYPIKREWADPVTGEVRSFDISTPRGLTDAGRVLDKKTLKGSGSLDIGNPFQAVIDHATTTVSASLANRGAAALADQMAALGLAQTTNENGDPLTKRDVFGEDNKLLPNVVEFSRNGKRAYAMMDDINDVDAFRAPKRMSNAGISALGKLSSFVRKGITTNPGFIFAQVPMDAINSMMLANVKHPFRVLKNTIKITAELMNDVRAGREFTNPHVVQLMKYGQGLRSDLVSPDLNEFLLSNEKELGFIGNWWEGSKINKAVGFMEKLGAASDMAARAAVYGEVLADTGDVNQGLNAARELINYNRRGTSSIAGALIQTVPFTSSYIQGTNVALRTYANRGNISGLDQATAAKNFKRNAVKLLGMSSLYAMMTADDEELNALDPAARAKGIYIPVAGSYAVIPVRPELGSVFLSIPHEVLRAFRKSMKGEDVDILNRTLRIAGTIAMDFPIPVALKPLIETTTNYNFYTGDPIVTGRMQGAKGDLQTTSATSEMAKIISSVTGYSAIKTDHLLNSYFTTIAAAANIFMYNALRVADGEEGRPSRAWTKNPLVSRFFKDADNYTLGQAYEIMDESSQVYSAGMRAYQVGDKATLDKIRNNYAEEFRRGRQMNALRVPLGTISKAIEANKYAKGISDEERRERDITLKRMRTNIALQITKLGKAE